MIRRILERLGLRQRATYREEILAASPLTHYRVADSKATPPREGWVVLLDSQRREVSERRPVVVDCDPLEFSVSHAIDFRHISPASFAWVRVIDADGATRDVPIA